MKRRKSRQVGKIHENLKVWALWYGGVGISTLENGKKVLIKWALPDSIVDVKIVKKKRDYLTGHIIKVHKVDEKWLDGDLRCPHHMSPYVPSPQTPLPTTSLGEGQSDPHIESKKWCGGCKRQAISYTKQLELKQDIVADCFSKFPKVEMLPIVWSPLQFGYRNKIEFSFGKYLRREFDPTNESKPHERPFVVAEHWQMGFHKQGEFSKVVDIDQCYLVSPKMHEVYNRIKSDLKNSGLPVHDAKTHHGLLRHLMIREWVHTDHILVNLSIASDHFADHPKHEQLWRDVLKKRKQDSELHEKVTTFVLSSNNGLADIMRDPDTTHEVIWWEGKIYEELHLKKSEERKWSQKNQIDHQTSSDTSSDFITMRFAISPASFFQTNTSGAEVLFATASEMVGEVWGNVIDLYCGGGSIGQIFLWLWQWQRVKGIEIVPAAIQDAKYNAKINHLSDRCDYYVGKAEKVVKEWVIDGEFLVWDDLVIVDPPREGMHLDVVKFLIQLKQYHKYRLCYISCNPITMARDIWLLLESWLFDFQSLQPVDMFPHTHHIECVGMLG